MIDLTGTNYACWLKRSSRGIALDHFTAGPLFLNFSIMDTELKIHERNVWRNWIVTLMRSRRLFWRANIPTGLLPAIIAVTVHGDYRPARDNVYSICSLGLTWPITDMPDHRRAGNNTRRPFDARLRVSMMSQVERFKYT
jgi:hypothetical protein